MSQIAAASSPARYPLTFDPHSRTVGWIDLDEAQYRAASFLDERLLQGGAAPTSEPWATAVQAALIPPRRADFIFHIGHVGSTLLSRLLEAHPAVMAVREPAILRTLAQLHLNAAAGRSLGEAAALDDQVEVFLRLFARTWRPEQTALIKTTSFVSEMAGRLLEARPQARAILLSVTPMAYIRGVLGGPARTEAPAMAAFRLERLRLRLGDGAWSQSGLAEGEMIAMSWLSEMLALHAAAQVRPALWFDFDQMLAAPQAALAACFAHLGLAADAELIAAIVAGPILQRYAKATDHAYDAQSRREVLAQAEREHGTEVRAGVDWLRRMAEASPQIKTVLVDAARIRL